MKITFLGTGSMIPTKERKHSSILISYKNENILIDCGESTQSQLRLARISPAKITKILITHWHGDHVLGLPGLIQTLGASEYTKILEIYGTRDSKRYLKNMLSGFIGQTRVRIDIKEVRQGRFFENKDFCLEAARMDHSCPCLGYAFIEKDKGNINMSYVKRFGLERHPILKKLQEGKSIKWKGKLIDAKKATTLKKGKKITVIVDTLPTENAVKLAKGSDILISEATHMHDIKDKTKVYKHLTSRQAAQLAKKARVKKLVLTHFSQRYKDIKPLENEAKTIFKNTISSEDLMELSL